MTETGDPDGRRRRRWVGREVRLRYVDGRPRATDECTIAEVNDRGMRVDGRGQPAFLTMGQSRACIDREYLKGIERAGSPRKNVGPFSLILPAQRLNVWRNPIHRQPGFREDLSRQFVNRGKR